MSETQQVQNSAGSIQSPEKTEDMKVNEDKMEQSSPYLDRPGERDCQFFLRTGHCGYGYSCRYNHSRTHLPESVTYYKDQLPERIGQPDCEYFLKTGICKYGPTCKYHHPKDRNGAGPILFNVLGYPMRQGEKSCPYYMQTGICLFGVACKFHHPHPPTPPLNGHSAYAMPSFPSVGFPYACGVTMMPLPPAIYGAMSQPQAPQSQGYMPFMVAPTQGLLPPQGWGTYMAASNPIYNVNYQPDSSSSASVPVAVTSHHHSFSDRVECRFFVNTGTCKYGDDCRYIHPKERTFQSPPNLSNPVVLPARPEQPACRNFKAYRLCKFGTSCKFDHSMPLNPSNNTGLAMSSSPPRSPDSTTSSNSKPAAESQSSDTEKEYDSPAQADNSEVDDSSPPNLSNPVVLPARPEQPACPNFKAYGLCKFGTSCKFDHSMPLNPSNNTGLAMSSSPPRSPDSTTSSNGKPAAESQSSDSEKEDDSPTQADNSEVDDSSPPSRSDSTTLSNGKSDAENPSTETEKQDDNPAQLNKDSSDNSS